MLGLLGVFKGGSLVTRGMQGLLAASVPGRELGETGDARLACQELLLTGDARLAGSSVGRDRGCC